MATLPDGSDVSLITTEGWNLNPLSGVSLQALEGWNLSPPPIVELIEFSRGLYAGDSVGGPGGLKASRSPTASRGSTGVEKAGEGFANWHTEGWNANGS